MKKSIEAFKKMNRKNKIILVSILTGIIIIFGATTFAFFSSSINGEKQPLSVTTGTLRLDFNDVEGRGIIEGEMGIGGTVSKRMMISNTGTQDVTATIMWNELENTYLAQSLLYTIKQTQEYDINEEIDINTLEYNQEVPQAGVYVPRSEEPKKTALTRGILIPAGKKIYYEVTITYNHLNDVDQNADLNAWLYTSFTIEEGEQLEPFTITKENRNLIGYTGAENEELVIPETYQDENGRLYKVSSIAASAFYGCSGLTSVSIPDNVTSIGSLAFNGCSNLTSINVDENNQTYKSINGVLFTKDEKTLIRYPNSNADTSYTIPDGVTNIKGGAFNGCTGLTSIIIPDSVIDIKAGAFNGCTSLASVTIPNSVTSISNSAFISCTGLTSVTLGNRVTRIGLSAFKGCTSLMSVTIPDSVTSIGNSAFNGCSSLTAITYKGTDYTSKSAFTTAFTSVSGNTIGTNVFNSTGLLA